MRQLLALVLIFVLLPAAAAAQLTPSVLAPGKRVRLQLEDQVSGWTHGRVASVSADSLVLRESVPERLALAELRRLEASEGRNRGRWLLIGGLVGGTAGVVYSRATREDDPSDIGGIQGTTIGVANLLAGVLLGGTAGYFLAPERWRLVALPRPGNGE